MSISREEIEHIAELARLKLSDEEIKKFSPQLDSILEYVGHLQEVKVNEVAETATVSGLVDVWRADEVKEWDREEVLNALRQGELEAGQVKVKKVL
ncbi:Asp-tRNA(Asn)/Glu-tRNA(Gln) amidotransferase subunit GatC [Candidatus Falkowbacteria bacterium]|nr:Asp-tRNA(Asn)/Glu-tRNA(Gln) amidotransferase subunit GatC [Candidatus Falkowbacteria bacterium]